MPLFLAKVSKLLFQKKLFYKTPEGVCDFFLFVDAKSSRGNLFLSYCTSIGASHLNEPHSSTSVPRRLSLGMIDMVNFSTVAVEASLVIFAVPRLREPLYSVPHCPLCLFTIRSTPFVCGAVNSVYVPAGTCIPASLIAVDVVICVAALAPVLHTRS